MSHKDFLGNEIYAEDEVIFHCWNGLNTGRVVKETPKGFMVAYEAMGSRSAAEARVAPIIGPHPTYEDSVIFWDTVFVRPNDVAKVVMV